MSDALPLRPRAQAGSVPHTVLMPAQGVSFGKLIISGEHSVVHGCPALVASLPFESQADIVPVTPSTDIYLELPDIAADIHLSWDEAVARVAAVRQRHQSFLQGVLPITQVLAEPAELALVAALSLAPRGGWCMRLHSEVPVRAGLGSSAATIVAALKAIDQAFDLKTPAATLWQLGRDVEAFQHGRSSGTDIAAALYGGLQRFQAGHVTVLDRVSLMPGWQVWYSGKPATSTGEAVSHVGKYFPSAHACWSEFSAVENDVENALSQSSWSDFLQAVRRNHRALSAIGVVPDPVRAVIDNIEQAGGAAKICGAGAVRGEGAGAVLVLPPQPHGPVPGEILSRWKRLV